MAQASEQQFQVFEKAIAEGKSPYAASRIADTTIRRLKNGDGTRYEQALAISEERRAAIVDERMDELAMRPEPSPAIVNKWAEANHTGYATKNRIEVSGTLNHEAKVVVLADILGALSESQGLDLGLEDRPRGALSGAKGLLPAPAKPEAGPVPADRQP